MTFIQFSKSQEWFWSEVWQSAEHQADEDLRAERIHKFENADDAIAFLHQQTQSTNRQPPTSNL